MSHIIMQQDRRIKRTQQLLAKALITLTLEKGYEAVTIRDVTEYADVGYATFFRHFSDKDALLEKVLEVVLDDLTGLLVASTGEENGVQDGLIFFRYVQQHSEVVRVLLRSWGTSNLMQQIIEAGIQRVLDKDAPLGAGIVPREVVAYHIVTSSIALVQWWLEHDMLYSPEKMGEIYYTLIIHPSRGNNV